MRGGVRRKILLQRGERTFSQPPDLDAWFEEYVRGYDLVAWMQMARKRSQRHTGDAQEFLEHVKVDLFPDEVYVFTPKGEIMEMPRGATAVDLAYAIHTDIGNTCVGCRVDRRLVPLRTPLKTGESVEIVTAPGARPNPAWLNFVVTGKARANIRHFLKNLHQDEARILGRRMLNRELEYLGATVDTLEEDAVKTALQSFGLASLEELLGHVGLGVRPAPLVARILVPGRIDEQIDLPARRRRPIDAPAPLLIHGTEGMVVSLPKCCYPIPGDPIMGFITAGRGIVIHHPSCKNVIEFRSAPDKWVDVEWAPRLDREFSAEIALDVMNQRGVLATVAAGCADQNANIEGIELSERDEHHSNMRLTVGIRDRKHLADVIRVLRNIKTVVRVHRKRA